jgi:hypothetical protein
VPLDHFVVEARSWIPQFAVVDPYHPLPVPGETGDAVKECGRIPDMISESSVFLGDNHVGYDGSDRVSGSIAFDWNLQEVSNVHVVGFSPGVTTRKWVFKTGHGRGVVDCSHSITDTVAGSGSGSGNRVTMNYRSANGLVNVAPAIVASVTATISNSAVALHLDTTDFPSQGFAVYENGSTLQREVVVNPVCRPVLGPAGFLTLLFGLNKHDTFNVTVATNVTSGDIVASC